MNNKEKGWEFWGVVGFMVANLAILVTIVGFMLSLNTRMDQMATKADIARVEVDLKADIARVEVDLKADIARVEANITDIRNLLIDHIKDGHNHRKQKRKPASHSVKSKSQ